MQRQKEKKKSLEEIVTCTKNKQTKKTDLFHGGLGLNLAYLQDEIDRC